MLIDGIKQYAEELYSEQLAAEKGEDDDDDEELDLEASIKAEVAGIKKPTQEPLFIPIKLDVQCGMYVLLGPTDLVTNLLNVGQSYSSKPGHQSSRCPSSDTSVGMHMTTPIEKGRGLPSASVRCP
jgi:hypothetical protein